LAAEEANKVQDQLQELLVQVAVGVADGQQMLAHLVVLA
jgi:hypothetical protein